MQSDHTPRSTPAGPPADISVPGANAGPPGSEPASRRFKLASEILNGVLVLTLFPTVLGAAASIPFSVGTPRPEFKVEFGYFMIPSLDCPGGRCQQPEAKRLKVQSLEERPIAVQGVSVNDRSECIFVDGLKDKVMKFGDVSYVLSLCEPVKVIIATERGAAEYRFD